MIVCRMLPSAYNHLATDLRRHIAHAIDENWCFLLRREFNVVICQCVRFEWRVRFVATAGEEDSVGKRSVGGKRGR